MAVSLWTYIDPHLMSRACKMLSKPIRCPEERVTHVTLVCYTIPRLIHRDVFGEIVVVVINRMSGVSDEMLRVKFVHVLVDTDEVDT